MNQNSESHEIKRAGGILAAGTMVSRLLGLVRNQILSHYFGAGGAADAFIAAFTIPNALRRLFGEGGLTPVFVSLFTRQLDSSEKDWKSFIEQVFIWLNLILLAVFGLFFIFAPQIVLLYVPEFREIPGKFEQTVDLTRLLLPFLFFISWSALFMGIFNCFRRFAIPALGPAILNLAVVLGFPALIIFMGESWIRIEVFGVCILAGVVLQTAVFLPGLFKLSALPRLRWPKMDARILEFALLLAPSLIALGTHQLNIIVNRIFASGIPGAVSHLFYADLLIELPVSLIATSMSVAAMPSFSRLLSQNKQTELAQSFRDALSLNAALSFASMFGILALSTALIASLFQSGEFGSTDTLISSEALIFYALGLPFFCLMRSLLPLYFAQKDTKTPALCALAAVVVNFFLAWQFSQQMGAPGIALATSIASAFNFALLFLIIRKRFTYFFWKKSFVHIIHSFILAALMGGILYWINQSYLDEFWISEGQRWLKALWLIGFVILGIFLYALLAYATKLYAFEFLLSRRKSRLS